MVTNKPQFLAPGYYARLKSMRLTAFILLLLLLFHTIIRAQTDSTRLVRIGYVLGSSALFGLADYYAWNLIHVPVSIPYRLVQGTVQAAITYFLYREFGIGSAISFTILWWSWCDDLAYYGWANALNAFTWEGRNHNGFMGNGVTWAGWTPIGLLRKQGNIIDKYALIAQAIVGFSISMPILWWKP
jgi:hypothetical protein